MTTYTWNASEYAQSSSAQQTWARELLGKLQLKGDERVLDIGCGDGKVTAEIAKLVPDGSVVGVDQSGEMIELARTQYPPEMFPNLQFLEIDACQLPFESEFNVVFSNAALHWVADHLSVLHGIARSLRSQGKILLQMGGAGNGKAIFSVADELIRTTPWQDYFVNFSFPYFFYSPQDYREWFKTVELEPMRVELIPKEMTHVGEAGLAGWLRTTWLPYTQQVPETKREGFIQALVERYLQRHPVDEQGFIHVQMLRLEIEAKKNYGAAFTKRH
jgi:trans-aconitate methyltransferase